ncbi:hypothetical protein [Priestia megaterium]
MLIFILIIEGLIFFILKQIFGVLNTNLEVSSTIIIIINTIVYLFLLTKYAKNKKEYMILFLAYFIRILFLYWDLYGRNIFVLPNSGADSEMYNTFAIQYAQGLDEGQGGLYSIIVGLFYKMYGIQRILAQYVNVVLGIYTIVIVKRILELLKIDEKMKFYLILIVCFLPNSIIISSILIRESTMIFLITLSLFYFIKWWLKGTIPYFILAIILPLIAALFHSGAIAPIIGYVLCYIFYNPAYRKFNFNIRTGALGIGFLIIFFVINTLWGDILFGKFQNVESATDITNKVTSYTKGGSAYLEGLQVSSTTDLILYSPIRMFYFIASPLPWDWRGFNDIFAFVFSGMLYLITYVYAFRALRVKNNVDRNLIIVLLFITICTSLMFAWGVSNAGSALRHREKFIAVYVVLASISIHVLRKNRNLKESRKSI